jgi:hypothetical protein
MMGNEIRCRAIRCLAYSEPFEWHCVETDFNQSPKVFADQFGTVPMETEEAPLTQRYAPTDVLPVFETRSFGYTEGRRCSHTPRRAKGLLQSLPFGDREFEAAQAGSFVMVRNVTREKWAIQSRESQYSSEV